MGQGIRSYRRRRSRLRPSRSARRSAIPLSYSGAILKRRKSGFEHNSALESVSRELNFAGADESSRCAKTSDRIYLATQTLSTPSADTGVKDCEESYERSATATGVGLGQVQLVPGDDNKIVESMFGEIFDNASLLKVEVEQCVSLPELRTRPLCQFGIQKAMHLLRGNSIASVTGHVCVGKFPVIAELPAQYEERILDYFCSQGRDRETSKRYVSTRKVCHVVNGGYEHEGRWRLIDEGEYQISGIKWRTVEIEWQDPKVLRAISIMSSQVQKREFVVELSFLDEMVYLRRVIQDYINEHAIVLDVRRPLPRGFCKEICKAYGGGSEYSNNTLRHLVSIAAKIGMRTMLMMRKVIDEECPVIARSISKKDICEDSAEILDTRVFRTLLNSKTLRGAKNFISPDTNDEDRLNALYRIRFLAQEKGSYSGVDAKTLEFQLEAAIKGRKSIECFRLRILRDDSWPVAMGPLLQNILQTTKLDEDVLSNGSDPDDLLECLKVTYLQCAGGEGGSRVEQYEKFIQDRLRLESHSSDNFCFSDVQEPPSNLTHSQNREDTELGENDRELGASATEDGSSGLGIQPTTTCTRSDVLVPATENESLTAPDTPDTTEDCDEDIPNQVPEQEPAKDVLEQLSIEVHKMSWEEYNRTVLTNQEIFDLIISDPFQKAASGQAQEFSSSSRIAFIKFVKKVLVPGGHVFLILPQLQIPEWLEAFEDFELKTESTFLLLKVPEHVQRVKGKSFQNLMEVAVVARKPGRHPTRFKMDVISPYTQLPRNTYQRKAPIIDHISPPLNRLRFPGSKALVRTGEKAPALFWELMKTFCPAGGRVLDPFAATLSVGIAGIQTGRPCVLLEVDQTCLELAEARLRAFAAKHLEDGESYELPGTSDSFVYSLECDRTSAATDDQTANCSNSLQESPKDIVANRDPAGSESEQASAEVHGSAENVAANGDSVGSESEQASAEDTPDDVTGDQCGSTRPEGSVGNAEDPESWSSVAYDRGNTRVNGSSGTILQSEREKAGPTCDQTTLDSQGNGDKVAEESAGEAEANMQHAIAKNVGDNRIGNTDTFNHTVSETTCEKVDNNSKGKSSRRLGCVTDLPSTEGRPRRNRKKTSRFA